MTSSSARERVFQTLNGESSPQLPLGELVIDDDLVRELVGLEPETPLPWSAKKALLQRWNHDLVTVSLSHGWGNPTQPDFPTQLEEIRYWAEESPYFIFAIIDGPFSLAVRAWSWEEALIRFSHQDPELQAFLADALVETSQQLQTLVDAGIHGLIIGDDIAYRRGPYIRPAALRPHYFPFLTLMVATAQDLGLPVVFHSDGNLWPIWDDLLQTGINGIHGLDPNDSMSLAMARQRSPQSLALWGNLDPGWLMNLPDQETLMTHLNHLLQPVRHTPILFGTSSGLFPGLPLPILDTLYQTARHVWTEA